MFELFDKKQEIRQICDVNFYTARRLEDMAQSMERLAKSIEDEVSGGGSLTRADGQAALETSAALVCGDCNRCSLLEESEREDNYYLYYLLRTFEQKGQVETADMPRRFQNGCRRKERYLGQLNRNLGRAVMNLSWKNRFLESREAVASQFQEMASLLGEFSRQLDEARDVTQQWENAIRHSFRAQHMALRSLLILEYANGRREAYVTARTVNKRCVMSTDGAHCIERAIPGSFWSPARDSRMVIARQYTTVRFVEDGDYRMLCGVSRIPRQGESASGDNYTFVESPGSQVVMSLADGCGSGEMARQESKQVVELAEQLLESGFSARTTLKLVNTVTLLAGAQERPTTLDICCVDLYTGILECMKLGAAPTFLVSEEGVEILSVGTVPAGVEVSVDPQIQTRQLCEGNLLVMVSDGVLDALPGEDKEKLFCEFLESMAQSTPQEVADQAVEFAASFLPAVRDDMTVLAASLWKRE